MKKGIFEGTNLS